ncbi:MAG: S9 family peptidase, partial [Crocinitomicaceae bacterium]|nr:S9 family peptidase [Crocinitomicaceae bacterium]
MYKLSNIFFLIILTFSLFSCANKNANKKTNEIVIAKQIPLKDFFKNPEKTSYKISPDGSFYSFMAPYKNRMNIFIQKIGDSSSTQLTFEEARDIAGYFWPNNEQIVFLKDEAGDENFHLFGVNIDGSNLIGFTDFDGVRAQIIDDLPDQKDFVVIGLNKRNKQVFDPYRLNLKTGKISMLAENPGNIQGWMFDHDGKLRIATAIVDGVNQSILYRETEEDEFKTIITTNFKEGFNPQFFTFDNKNIIGSSNLGRDKYAIVEFNPITAKEVKVLYSNDDYDVNGAGYSRKRKVITAAYFESWKSERYYFDSTSKATFEKIQKQLPKYEIGITGVNKEENILILRTYSDKSLGA